MSDEGFQGRYPGGPNRHPDEDVGRRRRTTPLPSVGELEDRAERHLTKRKRKTRTRRIVLGFVLVVVVAVGAGFWLGFQTARTQAELAEEADRSQPIPLSESERRMLEMMRQQNPPQQQSPPPSQPRTP